MFPETREAIETVEKHARDEWRTAALLALHRVALHQETLTATDVYEELMRQPDAPTTHENRAMGPVMIRGAKEGWIEATDQLEVDETRSWCHNQLRRVWVSKVKKEKEAVQC